MTLETNWSLEDSKRFWRLEFLGSKKVGIEAYFLVSACHAIFEVEILGSCNGILCTNATMPATMLVSIAITTLSLLLLIANSSIAQGSYGQRSY